MNLHEAQVERYADLSPEHIRISKVIGLMTLAYNLGMRVARNPDHYSLSSPLDDLINEEFPERKTLIP